MISFRTRQAIGAAATVANALTGSPVEYMGRAVNLRIFGNGDIAGMTHQLSAFIGNEGALPLPSSSLQTATTAGAVKTDEDLIAVLPIPANTRLVHAVTNPGAASNFTFLYVAE